MTHSFLLFHRRMRRRPPRPNMPLAVSWTLVAGAAVSVLACAWTVGAWLRRVRLVGKVLWRSPRARRWRVAFSIADLAALVAVLAQGSAVAAPALALLASALATVWMLPAANEGICGEDGVAVGLEAARFDELAEWRLTGDHLRFRTRAEWRAVDLPHAQHAALRVRLTACCAERESSFSRGAGA